MQSLGKHMEADTDLESRVKQAKRWLSSKWVYDFMEIFMRNINTFLRIDKIVINDVSQEIYDTYQLQHQVGSGVVSVFKN